LTWAGAVQTALMKGYSLVSTREASVKLAGAEGTFENRIVYASDLALSPTSLTEEIWIL